MQLFFSKENNAKQFEIETLADYNKQVFYLNNVKGPPITIKQLQL